MSTAVKQSIAILILLLAVSIGVALWGLFEKQKLQTSNHSLSQQIADLETQQTKLITDSNKLKEQIQSLTEQVTSKDRERSKYQAQYEDIKSKFDQLNEQVTLLTKERDDLKERSTTIGSERDRLVKELKERPQKVVEKIVYKDKSSDDTTSSDASGDKKDVSGVVKQVEEESAKQQADESHWAEVFKQKAALEIDVEKSKKALDESAIQIVELKKQTADMQLVIDKLSSEREEIVRKIKYGEDLADNLSIELARAKNDQKFTADRAEKLSADNSSLQSQVKQLTTTKLSLEKTISRLTSDKEGLQKKLIESESVIQSRIDDIWKIKQNIDQRVGTMPKGNENQVELTPIVINADPQTQAAAGDVSEAEPAKNQAHIVSINQDNNFVIVDVGEKDGIKIGDSFRVYRSSKEIAKLEVIQLRRDIAAADIKKKTMPLQVGDLVR